MWDVHILVIIGAPRTSIVAIDIYQTPVSMPLNPQVIPNVAAIQRRARALAMVEAIVCPEWENRYYSYNCKWGPGEEMASMRNGEGDDWFLLFGSFGAGIKGQAHETQLAGDKELLAEARRCLPETFSSFLSEPAFSWEWMSFCYWRSRQDEVWSRVVLPRPERAELEDGSAEFLALLHEPAAAYLEFAEWYYERSLPLAFVEAIYRNEPLTEGAVKALNPDVSLADIAADAAEIGFALSGDASTPKE
jgi:hypothetical protein